MAEKSPLINGQEAAKMLGVHYSTAIRWAKNGHPSAGTRIKILGTVGGQYVIDRASVERLAQEINVVERLDRKLQEAVDRLDRKRREAASA